ncbi:hypothetical protein Rleg9DRAFT_1682 [Rhizobium leguminosarum bv. trifolii WSM597]|uniref:Uncharacterized protein n=1 Tax=Rhizobium leguminosarum bv. trifolii WSM597 TaxID=754764 RepID=J0GZ58_RHILT|nr:hypothetical protein [Rhizobium leguminosarum]EJB02868.1 hypothetical protein Rleg9DRAFT_1682 [Rhizobium leguminosarum bv. trifolii WSM597]
MLVHNWREVLKRAWSVRLLTFLLLIIIAEPVYLFFAAEWVAKSFYVRLGMSAFTGVIAAAAIVARIVLQQKISGDLNGKPSSER